ncbi:hypothetical protein KQI52_09460 [bacterium]|nr:hypothetical protein [bacterium]
MVQRLTLLLVLTLVVSCSTVLAKDLDWTFTEDDDGEPVAVAVMTDTFGENTALLIREFTGNVELVSGDTDQATLEFTLGGIKHASEKDVKTWSKRVDIDVDTGKKSWEIAGERKLVNWNHRPWYLDLKVTVPEGAMVDAQVLTGGLDAHDYTGPLHYESDTGGIHVNNCSGDFELLTKTGGVALRDVEGTLNVRTSTGGVSIRDVRLTSHSSVQTSTGGAEIENTYGELDVMLSTGGLQIRGHHDNLVAETHTGGIDVRDLSGKLRAGTDTGGVSLRYLGTGELTGLALHSGTGPISVELYESLAATIDVAIDDYDGEHEFHCDFPVDEQQERGDQFTARILRNGGGVPINLSTDDGMINIEEDIR